MKTPLPPHVQKLLDLPQNAAARARLSPMAVMAGPDADVVSRAEQESRNAQRSSRSGSRAELVVISTYHRAALARGVAEMEKIPTPYVRVGPTTEDGTFSARVSKKSSVDCMGLSLSGPPRAIREEVKGVTTRNARGEFEPFEVARVKPHQREALDRALRGGHVAIVSVVFGESPAETVCCVPWAWLRDRRRVRLAELRQFVVSPATYLDAVLGGRS